MQVGQSPPAAGRTDGKVSFVVFFLIWARRQNWTVPDFHIRVCHWLETCGDVGVLMVFRGAAKSTILAVYNAWRYYLDPTYRILHQGDQDSTAYKTSRDTRRVLQKHPLTKNLAEIRGEVKFWWTIGSNDERNPSMQAAGITSNVTSSRADEVQNDDVEVPRNITTPELREKMRHRLDEQTFILVPGGRKLFIGTPHTHDSIYEEKIEGGADVLKIPLFSVEHRIEETASASQFRVPFEPEYVFAGIGKFARLLTVGRDYKWKAGHIVFSEAPAQTIDCYAGCVWPERFDRVDLLNRRKETRTLNAWDSQYQLHSKPIGDARLDPNRIIPYDIEPVIREANREAAMHLGTVRIAGATCRWDVALGKINSDASVLAVVLTDDNGQLYWHRAVGLTGELAVFETGGDGKDEITGGQVMQIREIVVSLLLPRVVVEVNGPGGFAPALLRRALKGTGCAVVEEFSSVNKQKRILDAFEPPMSAGFLWAHTSVLDGPAWDQMIQFNPLAKNQADDYIDAGAGAIADTPVRIGKSVRNLTGQPRKHVFPGEGTFDVTFET